MNLLNINLNELELKWLFLSLMALLASAHLFGQIFSRYHLPQVIGEILGGIILGPSCLGLISPEICNKLFNCFLEQGKILSFLYWIGLILLMLTTGLKVNHLSNIKDKNILVTLIISSTILPIIGGYIYYQLYDFNKYKGILSTDLSMSIIVCISIAITSIPVISKIFIDLNIIDTQFARIVLSAAIIHDLILWLALDLAIKDTLDDQKSILTSTIITLIFLIFTLFIGPFFAKITTKSKVHLLSNSSRIGYIILICLSFVVLTNYLKINIIFGSLMAGIVLKSLPDKDFYLAKNSLTEVSLGIFIPIYFALVGIKINLIMYFDLKLFLSFLFISSALEICSVVIGLRLIKKKWLTSVNFGFAMNTRGGPGIVVASIAYEFAIINQIFFVTLVLVAIITSLFSGIWFKNIINRNLSLYEND